MILDALGDRAFAVAQWFIDKLPQVSYDCEALGGMGGYLDGVACFVNVDALAGVLGFILATEGVIWAVRAIQWVWDRLPTT